jgi:hypothetical protein
MLSIFDAGIAPKQLTGQTFKVSYRIAPLSICRSEKGKACFIWQVLEHSGVIILPHPKWFRKHTWAERKKNADGKTYKTTHCGFGDYVERVINIRVSKFLTDQNYSTFTLEVSK